MGQSAAEKREDIARANFKESRLETSPDIRRMLVEPEPILTKAKLGLRPYESL